MRRGAWLVELALIGCQQQPAAHHVIGTAPPAITTPDAMATTASVDAAVASISTIPVMPHPEPPVPVIARLVRLERRLNRSQAIFNAPCSDTAEPTLGVYRFDASADPSARDLIRDSDPVRPGGEARMRVTVPCPDLSQPELAKRIGHGDDFGTAGVLRPGKRYILWIDQGDIHDMYGADAEPSFGTAAIDEYDQPSRPLNMVHLGRVAITEKITPNQLELVDEKLHQPRELVRLCYGQGLANGIDVAGTIKLEVTIEADGTTTDWVATPSWPGNEIDRCVRDAMRTVTASTGSTGIGRQLHAHFEIAFSHRNNVTNRR